MTRARRGFSLPELLVVIAIMGILTGFAIPKIRTFKATNNMRSAQAQVASSIATARAAAVQKGNQGRFVLRGNNLAVEVRADTSRTVGVSQTGTLVLLSNIPLNERYGVSVTVRTAADSEVFFDARGFGRTGSGSMARIILTGSGKTDSVCVSSIGLIMKQGCGI